MSDALCIPPSRLRDHGRFAAAAARTRRRLPGGARPRSALHASRIGCQAIGLRIERLERAMCPRWHVDRTGIRLLCTWRGPGTEWLDDPRIDPRGLLGSAADAPATGQARPFDILLLKGSAWQGNAAGGAIHRSPQVAPGSDPRILVALDALWDD
ncbi:DUF1826 domain-containing protein [Thiocapsa bogorovii]|uniref:DUF1826 domain-containing protein n=1 Tax=Thiocapsa bogorovii TaxID=521689 RepID=UPI001E57A65E|nr:DUF1826 domain-containing protein [Thiocapsa bogorovii]UHD18496.1 DUF1826 domain-containing protein [Thiocapsa bogorovii]